MSDNVYQPAKEGAFLIHYRVQNPGKYSLRIYNSAGELVRELLDLESRWPVVDDVPWDGKNMNGEWVASDVYVIFFESDRYVRVAKILVVR